MNDSDSMRSFASRSRGAQRMLASAPATRRSDSLVALARLLTRRRADLIAANRRDLEQAQDQRLAAPLLNRLALSENKIAALVAGVEQLAATEDPVGRLIERVELDTGLDLRKVASPIGVLLIIFESRPDAVIQIGSLAMRSANAVLLKGGSEASASNRVLVDCLRDALTAASLPADAVQGVAGRAAVAELLRLDDCIDLVIPRGSGQLVRRIQSATHIPVLGHAEGICHVYLDAAADPAMATRIVLDSKCDYPAACNALETLLVHRDFLPALPQVCSALANAGVELRGDESVRAVWPGAVPANDADFGHEFGALVLALRTVDDLDEAIAHIHEFGSAHTDAIVTGDERNRLRFLNEVDSASVFVNASTRFADGYRYGLGAEVGISTARVHARGPVGIDGLMTTRWLLQGNGQVASDYGPGRRSFTHRRPG